jgi:putative two-component system response regulator
VHALSGKSRQGSGRGHLRLLGNHPRLLIVDDSGVATLAIASMVDEALGSDELVHASSGVAAIGAADREGDQLSMVLLDIQMPGMGGIEATAVLHERHPELPVIVYSVSLDPADVRGALEAGAAGYVVKSTDPEELRMAIMAAMAGKGVLSSEVARPVLEHYVHLIDETREQHRAVIESLAAAVEAKDAVTSYHLRRVARLAVDLAREIDPATAAGDDFLFGCLLHDIGKIGVPESILGKPGPLTDAEWTVMRTHPATGIQVIAPLDLGEVTRSVVLHHHERWDGNGYPDGLAGTDIPLAARIFAVCDSFDAMTSDRPYRRAMPIPPALDRIRAEAGGQFDPAVVDALVEAAGAGVIVPADEPASDLPAAGAGVGPRGAGQGDG